jgi:hypothetical protein
MFSHLWYADLIVESRAREAERQAEINNMLRQAGSLRQGWFSRQAHQLMRFLGRFLVALGQRLKQYQSPQPIPLQGETCCTLEA